MLLPERIVEDAIAKAPSSVRWYNQAQDKEVFRDVSWV